MIPFATPSKSTPGIGTASLFLFKAAAFKLLRLVRNVLIDRPKRHPRSDRLLTETILAESKTVLRYSTGREELSLEAGKVHNLRIAIRSLDGVEVPADSFFSFWAQVGHPGRFSGFVRGRELRQGCLIPSIGGGLCQLSNALYDAALQAGFTILERHRHSEVIPGSLAEIDRDATVFWNYVDLRFRCATPFRIEASMTGDHLTVRFRGRERVRQQSESLIVLGRAAAASGPADCASCGVEECFRHRDQGRASRPFGATAYLVDEYWPEFDKYIQSQRTERDVLCLPIDGRSYHRANYAWDTRGFGVVRQRRCSTLLRALQSRRLAREGAARQRALLKFDDRLARTFARALGQDITHVVVTQSLLPFLWREGHLGGRTFDVLMTRFPIEILQQRLDRAARLHPESHTLADFRADESLARAERDALLQARRVITPHREIAGMFAAQAQLLDWILPRVKRHPHVGGKIIFPSSTLGRKGVYELRQAARALDIEIVLVGPELEKGGFWSGLRTSHRQYDDNWLDEAAAVALPSFIEHQPRRLLEAVASGVPVIASRACGLLGIEGVITVPEGQADVLLMELRKLCGHSPISSSFEGQGISRPQPIL